MVYIATITSKRQLTIPVELYELFNLSAGDKMLMYGEDKTITMEPAASLVERLAGSVKIPQRFKGLSAEKIIQKAKKEYFKNK